MDIAFKHAQPLRPSCFPPFSSTPSSFFPGQTTIFLWKIKRKSIFSPKNINGKPRNCRPFFSFDEATQLPTASNGGKLKAFHQMERGFHLFRFLLFCLCL